MREGTPRDGLGAILSPHVPTSLKYRPPLHRLLAPQRKSLLPLRSVQNPRRHVLPDRRPVLEPVPRPAAHEPNVLHLRMPVDQKISVPSIFVLAYAGLHNPPPPHPRKPLLHRTPRLCPPARPPQ